MEFIAIILFIFIVFLYFLPTVIAIQSKHKHVAPIMIINIFLGWTLLGWVGALVWSAMR
jgi:hypothetical protein